MDTLTYILNKYTLKRNQDQHKLYRSRWGSLATLFKDLRFTKGAEVGVGTGEFSKFLCSINPSLKLYSVDMWENKGVYNKAKDRLSGFNCQLVKGKSTKIAKKFVNKSLDFVFIDAAHDYKSVRDDIREWSKKVRVGGIVAGHDYNNGLHGQPRGVKQAVNEWIEKNEIKPLFVFNKDGCPTWFYVKNA